MELVCSIKAHKNGLALVEFNKPDGNICRTWVKDDKISKQGSDYFVENPMMGIPYGVAFSEHLQDLGSIAQDIEEALYRNGIWTWSDVTTRTDLVKKAYAEALGVFSKDLIALAVKQQKDFK